MANISWLERRTGYSLLLLVVVMISGIRISTDMRIVQDSVAMLE